jgi:ketosteroid isomerase-like protein
MQGWKAAMPDVRGRVTGAAEEGQRVVLEIMWEGTQTGELVTEQGTIPASGNRQRTPAAWIFDYEGGQLRESRHYFDMLTFLPADRSRAITAGRGSRPVGRVLC